MRRTLRGMVAVLWSAALGGCAVQPESGWESRLDAEVRDCAAVFPGAAEVFTGLDPVGPSKRLAVGDEVLYGLCLDVGAKRKIWYLRLEVLELGPRLWVMFRGLQDFEARVHRADRSAAVEPARRPPSGVREAHDLNELRSEVRVARVRVEALDAAGQSLGAEESEALVPRLEAGLFAACVAGHAQRDAMRGRVAMGRKAPMLPLDDAAWRDVQAAAEGVAACDTFFELLQKNRVTKQILMQVIALPTLWSVVRNLGVRTGFSIDLFAASEVPSRRYASARRALWRVPLTVELNGQPALLAHLVVGPSGAPDGVAAGVFGLVGRHPSDPERRIRVQLLASRRRVARPADGSAKGARKR